MRALFITAVIVLAGFTTSARADSPSFDCEQATTPIEYLICGDHELGRLDAKLAKLIAVQERRDWLQDRLKRCGIPAKGGAPEEPQTWRWAPCVAELSRERLRRLGQDEPDPVMPADPDFVHPLCLLTRPIDLTACTRGYHHVPVQRIEGRDWYRSGWLAVGGDWAGGLATEFHRIGAWSGGEALLVNDSFEGSGQDFSIHVLKRAGDTATLDYVFDRSSGFVDGDAMDDAIVGAKVFDDGRIEVERQVTPYGLIRFANPLGPEDMVDGLTFADAYYGTVRQEFSTMNQDGKALSVTLGLKDAASGKVAIPTATPSREDTPRQACFDKLFADPGQPLPRTLGAAEYEDLVKAYMTTCAGKAK